jgi:signal transduction histidine kinase
VHEEALTAELPRPRPGALSDPTARFTAVAGALLLGALAAALQDARVAITLSLLAAGVAFALFVLVPRAAAGIQRHPMLLAGALLAALPVVGGLLFGYVFDGGYLYGLPSLFAELAPVMLIALSALGGVVLLADDLRSSGGGPTPWQRLMGATDAPARAPWRSLAGVALIGLAVVLALALARANQGGGLAGVIVVLALTAGAVALIATPLLIGGLARADRSRVANAREDERRRVAAHLHDSVLQTLALVQRQAHDPAAVQRLARRQEHELRAWMAGEVELGAETLGAALRRALAEVEDDHDAVIELTLLGERPLDRPTEALVAAAREALRNAARHAPGALIFVFAQASADGAEVFVRDEGPGFDLPTVPTERRGVRDSIIGRMAAVGGSANVESRPGEGTEIALRIGVV